MATPKLTTWKCPTCAAPLHVPPPPTTNVQCRYCGNSVHIERAKPPAQARGFVPPPNTIYVHPSVGRSIGAWVAIAVIVPIVATLAIGGIAAATAFRAARPGASPGLPGMGPRKVDSFPATCGMNEHILVSGKTFTGTGTLIEADINCKLTIEDSTLKADVVAQTKGLSEITITNSKLEGKENALVLATNTKVKVDKQSEVVGGEHAIDGGTNIDVTLEGSSLRGGDAAVHGGLNFKLHATNAQIAAKEKALDLGLNADLDLKQTKISGEDEGVHTDYNLTVTMAGSTIEAPTGIKSGLNAKLKILKKSRITGKDVGIDVGSNLELTVADGLVQSPGIAVKATTNPKIEVSKQGKIDGGKVGVRGTTNMEVTLEEGTIESAGDAIEASYNTRIEATSSTIHGGKNAFLFERKPQTLSLTDTNVVGARNFSHRR